MSAITTPAPLIRNAADAERRWFYGGGIVTWLAKAEDTAGTFLLSETEMEQGKVTPLHTHPADESMFVLEGELLVHMDGHESILRTGGLSIAPRGVPHAFKVLSPVARVLALHTPGTCEAFYMGASEPIGPDVNSGPVDFDRITESGRLNGGFELIGPPPFAMD
jgi:quercetin dioxygenase-like cupin family protein